MWMELLTTRLSPAWHFWTFQKCSWHLSNLELGTPPPRSEWESRPSPEEPEVHLYFTNCTRLHHCWLLHYVTMKPTHSLPRTPNIKCRSLQLIEVCTLTRRRRRRHPENKHTVTCTLLIKVRTQTQSNKNALFFHGSAHETKRIVYIRYYNAQTCC